jgi:predicted PurR-regulated permease PerM
MNFLSSVFTGADNQSFAIGRVLGGLLFLNLLLCLPVTIALALWLKNVDAPVWFAYLTALAVYVPAICLSVGGLIRGTASTEPKPAPPAA